MSLRRNFMGHAPTEKRQITGPEPNTNTQTRSPNARTAEASPNSCRIVLSGWNIHMVQKASTLAPDPAPPWFANTMVTESVSTLIAIQPNGSLAQRPPGFGRAGSSLSGAFAEVIPH